MPYEFNPESFAKFTQDILNANGDQATITDVIGDMSDTMTDAFSAMAKAKEDIDTITAERDRLRDTNSRLILRVGSFDKQKVGTEQQEPEHLSTKSRLEKYIAEHGV